MLSNDSEIIHSNGIGLFTTGTIEDDGDSLDRGEAPEDTIGDNDKHECSEITRVTNSLCTNDCVGSDRWSLNEHTAPCHFRFCLEMKVG